MRDDDDDDDNRGLARGAVGRAQTIAFGTSVVAPAASAATVLVLVVASAGFASPLVILITFAGSVCCALSIGQFAGRVPSAGWSYTYNSHGLGPTAGFLTGWMMVFAYALLVPAGVALSSAFASQLLASTVHVTVSSWILFIVILAAGVLVAYLGVRASSWFWWLPKWRSSRRWPSPSWSRSGRPAIRPRSCHRGHRPISGLPTSLTR